MGERGREKKRRDEREKAGREKVAERGREQGR